MVRSKDDEGGTDMKAIITIIDDNGKVICKDRVFDPVKEEIVNLNPDQPPIKETRFAFKITQLADFQFTFSQNKEDKT